MTFQYHWASGSPVRLGDGAGRAAGDDVPIDGAGRVTLVSHTDLGDEESVLVVLVERFAHALDRPPRGASLHGLDRDGVSDVRVDAVGLVEEPEDAAAGLGELDIQRLDELLFAVRCHVVLDDVVADDRRVALGDVQVRLLQRGEQDHRCGGQEHGEDTEAAGAEPQHPEDHGGDDHPPQIPRHDGRLRTRRSAASRRPRRTAPRSTGLP